MTKSSRVARSLLGLALGVLPFLSACATTVDPSEQVENDEAELGGGQPVRCDRVSFPVALGEGQPAAYHVVGWLCGRGSIEHKTIQVLVHGITYSHVYWDFPYKPGQYSYVHALTAAGYATLALDRIGIGESDHPSALKVTVHSNAHVLHQVVEQLRSGTLHTPSFGDVAASRLMLVGHSLGSSISMLEAATYHDVDGVIVTGYLHNTGPGALSVATKMLPAQLDPRFAGRHLPLGYLTTASGGRGGDYFYHAPSTEPAVVAQDEATKETGTLGEAFDNSAGASASPGIEVPVLSVVGDFDRLACNAPSCTASGILETEGGHFSPAARFQIVVLPAVGHVINLHEQAPRWFALAADWSNRNIGSDTRLPAPNAP